MGYDNNFEAFNNKRQGSQDDANNLEARHRRIRSILSRTYDRRRIGPEDVIELLAPKLCFSNYQVLVGAVAAIYRMRGAERPSAVDRRVARSRRWNVLLFYK